MGHPMLGNGILCLHPAHSLHMDTTFYLDPTTAAVAPTEWIQRCADRLRRQWPTISTVDLEDTASALQADHRLRKMLPEGTAVAWLSQGVLLDGGRLRQ